MIEQTTEQQIIDLKTRIAAIEEIERKFLVDGFGLSEWDKNNCVNAMMPATLTLKRKTR
jgi:hypothetical protein